MSRIGKKFQELKREKKKALIPFITAGYPDLETTCKLVLALEENGADIVELGVPFSDPLADGPTIQKTSQHALDAGVTPDKVLDTVRKIRERSSVPIVLMLYYNIIMQMGEERFVHNSVLAGVDGIIVPDLPLEESVSLRAHAEKAGLDLIFLIAPTSTPERIKNLCSASRGFVYYVSLTGVTGVRNALASSIKEKVEKIEACTDLPVCVGFGISSAEQAEEVSSFSDGVVVGSALLKVIGDAKPGEVIKSAGNFISSLRNVSKN